MGNGYLPVVEFDELRGDYAVLIDRDGGEVLLHKREIAMMAGAFARAGHVAEAPVKAAELEPA